MFPPHHNRAHLHRSPRHVCRCHARLRRDPRAPRLPHHRGGVLAQTAPRRKNPQHKLRPGLGFLAPQNLGPCASAHLTALSSAFLSGGDRVYVSRISPGISAVSVVRSRSLRTERSCRMFSIKVFRRPAIVLALGSLCSLSIGASDDAAAHSGYYREPALHGDTLIFTAEGDLWSVSVQGGAAHRLTSAPGREGMAKLSPDGQTVAFYAAYEGPGEV